MASFGEGLGGIIGGALGAEDLASGSRGIDSIGSNFQAATQPYNQFGQSFLAPATAAISDVNNTAHGVQSYEDFMKNYETSPGAKYQIQQADEAQNNSATAKGGLLSGTNLRALSTINQDIASTYANRAYGSYLQGNQQQFGQLETALGNMFNAIGVGTTATGQQGALNASQMGATSQIAQAQAKNDQGKGSGFGSLFSGLGSVAAMF